MSERIVSLLRVLGLAAAMVAPAGAADLVLYYEERPPLMSRQDDQLVGVLGTPAMAVLQRAGLAVELREAPVARQMVVLARQPEPACALGLYRTPEREKQGRFSRLPVYASPPQSLLIRRDGPLKDVHRLAHVLQLPGVTLALRLAYSYGAETDKALADARARVLRTADPSLSRARLVLLGIADATLFTEEEGQLLIRQLGDVGAALELRRLPDAPPGEGRYFFCNKALPERQMRAIDDAMAPPR